RARAWALVFARRRVANLCLHSRADARLQGQSNGSRGEPLCLGTPDADCPLPTSRLRRRTQIGTYQGSSWNVQYVVNSDRDEVRGREQARVHPRAFNEQHSRVVETTKGPIRPSNREGNEAPRRIVSSPRSNLWRRDRTAECESRSVDYPQRTRPRDRSC